MMRQFVAIRASEQPAKSVRRERIVARLLGRRGKNQYPAALGVCAGRKSARSRYAIYPLDFSNELRLLRERH